MPGGLQGFPGDVNIGGNLFVQGAVTVGAGGSLAPTFPLTAPDGSAAAPSYAFSSSLGTGAWQSSGNLVFSAGGIRQLALGSGAVFVDIGVLNIRDIVNGTFVSLNVPTAVSDTLEQRRGVNPQTFNLYNTYTNSGNYERLKIAWTANVLTFSSENIGSGTARQITFQTNGQPIEFNNGSTLWQISGAGHLLGFADNVRDIGAAGSNRPRNLYLGSAIFTTAPTAQAAGAYTVLSTDNTVINSVASTLTLPAVATSTGRKLRVVTTGANAIISNASNVVPITGGAAGTAILAATAGKWADLECNGTNWIVTAAN